MTIDPAPQRKKLRELETLLPSAKFATAHPMSRPQALPVEILEHIMLYMSYRELLQTMLACKDFNRIIRESHKLQYLIELAKVRMVPTASLDVKPLISQRSELLKEREQAWGTLGWKRKAYLDLPPTGSLYEFVGGVYANGKEASNRLTTSISFIELPTSIAGSSQELTTWTHTMPDLSIVDFTMDPAQDLLVLVTVAPSNSGYVYDVHIRSIKTAASHPKAPKSTFPSLLRPSAPTTVPQEVVTAVRVQVCGDAVALLIKDVSDNVTGGHLEVWNWRAGPAHSAVMPQTDGIDDFSFLTESSLLAVRPSGQFEVWGYEDPAVCSSEPSLRYSLAFPPLTEKYQYWYISMSNNPTPGCMPKSKSEMDRFLRNYKPVYHPDPKERVHACCLYIYNPEDPTIQAVSSFVFFLRIETLLNPPMEWFQRPIALDGKTAYCHPSMFADRREEFEAGLPPPPSSEKVRHCCPEPATSTSSTCSVYGGSDSEECSLPALEEVPLHGFLTDGTGDSTPGDATVTVGSMFLNLEPATIPPGEEVVQVLPELPPHPDDERRKAAVPWHFWGPSITRWFEECLSTDWQHAIYGLRAVESVKASKLEEEINERRREEAVMAEEGSSRRMRTRQSNSTSTPKSPLGPVVIATLIKSEMIQMAAAAASATAGTPAHHIPSPPAGELKFLRVRDFSPYSLYLAEQKEMKEGKRKRHWREQRVVRGENLVQTRGVFQYDIRSSLPYVEVISEEAFDLTDVMMDDERLLLLKRGPDGKLREMEVLMM